MKPLPHSALVTVTGWATPGPIGIIVGGLSIRTRWELTGPQRVTVRAYPRTRPDGTLRELFALRRNVKPARVPNGSSVRVTGQLLKLDRGEGVIRVKVCPAVSDDKPFVIALQAAGAVLDLDPVTFHVRVTGRVLGVAGGVLLAEAVEAVYAPVPAKWHRWRPKRAKIVPWPPEVEWVCPEPGKMLFPLYAAPRPTAAPPGLSLIDLLTHHRERLNEHGPDHNHLPGLVAALETQRQSTPEEPK
ncbi:hypothetical protein [Deinococcus sp. QL22]|uniref:hypothetical protein n=1 Tax=Deinococcus sp. QL22 TaxID=2939437 RepID=UPI002017FF77|nr:hypothetical protein [Deinococcus sp. QL22]UQN10392.1 hypothetical protein M1R55_30020 [Deinococcus sp. QL22]UQN10526.1 hypothetical protein M1R55_29345 [Deinococcus sp. QL22]